MRYADPKLCPDCRGGLPSGAPVCPTCDLLVRHPLAVELFATLQRADAVLSLLRAASERADRADRAVAAAVTPSGSGGPLAPPASRGVSSASVPKILLGLGALCLLVAAVVFIAVSWSMLGVGGRTGVLAGLTLAAGAAALLLHRAGLRIAGECLVIVALGMLALDVLGAGAAGWLGRNEGVTVGTAGLLVAATGSLLGLVQAPTRPRLVAPQIVAGLGLVVGYLGALAATDHRLIAGHLLIAAGIAIALAGRRWGATTLRWSATAAAALTWLGTAGLALTESLLTPDLHRLWLDGTGWSLLGSAVALVVPGLAARRSDLLLAGASGAALLVTVVVTLPCADTDARTVGLVALGTTAGWALALGLLPRGITMVAWAPAGAGCLVLAGLALQTVSTALDRWSRAGDVFQQPAGVRLTSPDPVGEPLLLVPSLLVILACLALADLDRSRGALPGWSRGAAAVAGLGAAATLASYDVALALPLGVLTLVALGTAALALRTTGTEATTWSAACVALTAAVAVGALPSDVLTLASLAPLAVTLIALAVVGRSPAARVITGAGAPPSLGLAAAAAVMVAGNDEAWVSIPVLAVVGVLALALARLDVELSAVAVALLALPVSLTATSDVGGHTALWLTVAGFLVAGTALLHESRHGCAPAGGALLLLASWVRLADLGVAAPEPYTLPLAAALLALGLWRLHHSPVLGTAETLLPGLLLGTVPSLLWVLAEPVSARALVLGAGCLALTIVGATMRWSAPLVVGATVGAAVVLRELGPYAGAFPTWVWIGLAGALLTVVGITWERRLLDVRRAARVIGRLR